eukprot:5390464-Alexandrium_andersonii.AAC.1
MQQGSREHPATALSTLEATAPRPSTLRLRPRVSQRGRRRPRSSGSPAAGQASDSRGAEDVQPVDPVS